MQAFAAGVIAVQLTAAGFTTPPPRIFSTQDGVAGARSTQEGVSQESATETYQAPFTSRSLPDALQALGVSLGELDKVSAFPDPRLGVGSKIVVSRAPSISIIDGREAPIVVPTWKKTVTGALGERGLELASQDRLSVSGETPVQNGLEVKITRVERRETVVRVNLPPKTITIDDAELQRGTERVREAGSAGVREDVYEVIRENGLEVSRRLLRQSVVKPPVDRVIAKGTKIVTYGEGGASWYGGVPLRTAAHRTLPFGTMVRVVALASGRSVVVRIADRGPFISGRVIDLSRDSFAELAPIGAGVIQVRLEVP